MPRSRGLSVYLRNSLLDDLSIGLLARAASYGLVLRHNHWLLRQGGAFEAAGVTARQLVGARVKRLCVRGLRNHLGGQ